MHSSELIGTLVRHHKNRELRLRLGLRQTDVMYIHGLTAGRRKQRKVDPDDGTG
jgi:hypothetical protein